VTVSILGSERPTLIARVAGLRNTCIPAGSWYLCRGPYVEALLPVAVVYAAEL
jgi:hypothetical protein